MNKKLKGIGGKLKVSEDDIDEIKKGKTREWIVDNLVELILSLFLVFSSSFLAISIIDDPTNGYPYSVISAAPLAIKNKKGVTPFIALLLMLIVTVILIFTLYSMVPKYGVYSREKKLEEIKGVYL